MRVHLMLRNVQGLWTCTDAGCSHAPSRLSYCPTGALHYVPVLTCQCGSRVLELLYCEPCGEVFFGGYRQATGNPNEWYLSPDRPNLEAAPDQSSLDRDYDNYAVFWPAPDAQTPSTSNWTENTIGRSCGGQASAQRMEGLVLVVSADPSRATSTTFQVFTGGDYQNLRRPGAHPAICPDATRTGGVEGRSEPRFGHREPVSKGLPRS